MASTQAVAAKAIRAELKAAFPGVKFSVRAQSASMMTAADIEWTDGPTTAQVEAVAGKYQYGHFDGMDDSYKGSNHRPDLAAQVKYVDTRRNMSDVTKQGIVSGLAGLGVTSDDPWWTLPRQLWSRADLRSGFVGVRQTDVKCGQDVDFFEVVTGDSPAETPARCDRCSSILTDGRCVPCEERAAAETEAKQRMAECQAREQRARGALADVVAVEVIGDVRCKADFAKLNKNGTLDEYRREVDRGDYDTLDVQVTHRIDMTADQFEQFSGQLMTDWDFLAGLGGTDSDYPFDGSDIELMNNREEFDKWRAQSYRLGVLVTSPDGQSIICDPQGHNYARYVGINVSGLAEQEVSQPFALRLVGVDGDQPVAFGDVEAFAWI